MKCFLPVVITTFLITGAQAADLYKGGSFKDGAPVIAPPATWSGFYLGGNAGGARTTLDSSLSAEDSDWSATLNHTNAAVGFVGGGQAGYNFQTGAFLLGLEADFGYLGTDNTRNLVEASWGGGHVALGTKIEGGFLADVTGRLGFVSGSALFYLKGGWAYFDGTVGTSGIDALGIKGVQDVHTSGLDGWTVGGGVEYLLTPSWSLKAEYQHFDFGSVDWAPIADRTDFVIKNDLAADVVKVGLNWRFGGAYK